MKNKSASALTTNLEIDSIRNPGEAGLQAGLCVFLPVFNEAATLAGTVDILRSWLARNAGGAPAEIIIGDNGSTDGTAALAEDISARFPEDVKCLRVPTRGPGWALKEALSRTQAEFLIVMDADMAVGPEFIFSAVRLLAECDIVVGSKRAGSERRPWWRRGASGLFVFLARIFLKMPFSDCSQGAKAYRRTALTAYRELIGRWEDYVLRILHFAHRDGLRIRQIPVAFVNWRPSHFNLLRLAFHRIATLAALCAPRRFSTVLLRDL